MDRSPARVLDASGASTATVPSRATPEAEDAGHGTHWTADESRSPGPT